MRRTLLVGIGAALAACGGSTATPPPPTSAPPTTAPPNMPPVLSVPIVDLALVNDFLPFGFSLSSGRLNPTYELRTASDTPSVRAAGPGVVANILANPGPDADSEVHVRPPDSSEYLVIYDHVVSLQVATGQSVAAGQVLGRIAPMSRGGRTELQVNRTSGQTTLALCPRDFGTTDFNAAHDAALARFPGRGGSVCLTGSVQP